MKKLILAAAVTAAFASSFAQAEEKKSDHEISFNAAVVSDYRYRGLSQTRLKPALQGGADYVHAPTGLYIGTWASTIKWVKDGGGNANVEIDVYAGKRGEIAKNVTYDVGLLKYIYPSHDLAVSPDTLEAYGQVGFGPAYVKFSHSTSNLFGFIDTKRSGYLDVGANIEAGGGFIVNLHAGHQSVHNNRALRYSDWKVGVTKDFGVVTGALAYIGTNADKTLYASPVNGKFVGKNALVLTVSKTF